MHAWPVAWWKRFPDERDGILVALLRFLGVVSLLFFLFAVLGLIAGVQSMGTSDNGWNDLITFLAFMFAAGGLIIGAVFSWIAHVGSVRYRADADGQRILRLPAWLLVGVGATFWAPLAWMAYPTPLDRYLAVLRAGMLLVGGLILWRIRRNPGRAD